MNFIVLKVLLDYFFAGFNNKFGIELPAHEQYSGTNPISVNYCICKLLPYNLMCVIFIAIQMHIHRY